MSATVNVFTLAIVTCFSSSIFSSCTIAKNSALVLIYSIPTNAPISSASLTPNSALVILISSTSISPNSALVFLYSIFINFAIFFAVDAEFNKAEFNELYCII